MKKLTLDMEALQVESFAVEFAADGGTVHGRDSWDTCTCPAPPPTGKTECTCWQTCQYTCGMQMTCTPCDP